MWKGAGGSLIFSQSRGHLLAYVLDHLPLARNDLQRLSDRLAELTQAIAAAAVARRWCWNDDALAWQVCGERLASRPQPRELRNIRRLGRRKLGGGLVFGNRRLQLSVSDAPSPR